MRDLHRTAELPHKDNERAGDKARGERVERAVILRELEDDHHSGMSFEVVVEHPEWVLHPEGGALPRSRQAPEIHRYQNLDDAKRAYAALVGALGGELADDFEPPTEPTASSSGISSTDVLAAIDFATRPLLERIAELEKKAASKPSG